ncbi:MAG: PKD domain-containing protein [Actinomycetota bacterium]|nr:PKD domain-containing protein [Actinomycetota bacterium]
MMTEETRGTDRAGTAVSVGDLACDASSGYDGPSGAGTLRAKDLCPGGHVVRCTWSWGDGSAPTVSTKPVASHAFPGPGTYRVSLTLRDNYGVSGTVSFEATVG